jgi:tetratricopeptide (TPR) repeat protein
MLQAGSVCPDDAAIFDFVHGTLEASAEADIKQHLDACDECRVLVSETAKSLRFAQGSAPQETALPRGHVIGRYQLLGVLGTGGMGIVYEAHDPELDRRVALKLLRADIEGGEDTEALQRRLSREARAMAKLSHENVLMVYDAGTYEGRVFVAMERVEGMVARAWLKSAPRRWQDVLKLYIKAGQGLAAAHRAGLVHRDFKPDNVLVGDDGRVRVTDFGLARPVGRATAAVPAVDPHAPDVARIASYTTFPPDSQPTVPGVAVGTPGYMAPERMLGKAADERSDQFSFCVALYEGLYGKSPFARTIEGRLAELSAGKTAEPPSPPRIPARVRRAILRGLSAKPSDRYASMADLLAVLEKRPWPVRYMPPLLAAAVVVVAFVAQRQLAHAPPAACGDPAARLAGVWDAARKADVQRAFAATQVPYATDSWVSVSRLLDDYTTRWTTMGSEACEATRVRHEQSEELFDLRAVCLDDRLRSVGALAKVFAEADAKVVEKSVDAVERLPALDGCANKTALLSGARPPSDPTMAARAAAVRDRIAKASALEDAGKYREGLAVAKNSLAEARNLDYLPVEAEALFRVGDIEYDLEDDKAAASTQQEAAAVAEASRSYQFAARAWFVVAYFAGYVDRRYEDGRRFLRYAATAIERSGGSEQLEAERLHVLGILAWAEGKTTEALEIDQRSKDLFERTVGPMSGYFAIALNGLAMDYRNLGKHREALDADEQALAIYERAYGPLHPRVAKLLNVLATEQGQLGRYDEALASYRRSLDIAEQTLGTENPDYIRALEDVGRVLAGIGRFEEALKYLKLACASWEKAGKLSSPEYAYALGYLGAAERKAGALDAALASHRKALGILLATLGEQHPDIGWIRYHIGEVWLAKGMYQASVDELTIALHLVDRPTDGNVATTAVVLTALGEAYFGLHDIARAAPPLERALALHASNPADPSDLARAQFALARVLWSTGNHERAQQLVSQARDTYASASYFKDELRRVDNWIAAHRGTRAKTL